MVNVIFTGTDSEKEKRAIRKLERKTKTSVYRCEVCNSIIPADSFGKNNNHCPFCNAKLTDNLIQIL